MSSLIIYIYKAIEIIEESCGDLTKCLTKFLGMTLYLAGWNSKIYLSTIESLVKNLIRISNEVETIIEEVGRASKCFLN
jgi:hypothetical protein